MSSTETDEQLIELYVQTKNEVYYHVLFERYMPLMYGLCLKYLGNEQNAKDAVVFLFEDVAVKVRKYSIGEFKNWLYSVTKFYCFSLLKKQKKEIIVDFNTEFVEYDFPDTLLDEKQEEDDRLRAVEDCIQKLPEPQRISIVAFFYDNKSYVEIVEATKYNLKSVKSYIQNGRRNLKICLEKKMKSEN